MAKMVDGAKKRKPPTFRHLPADRAQKLKRSWVEKQKIKTQWKAQKRKETQLAALADGGGNEGTAPENDPSDKDDAEQVPGPFSSRRTITRESSGEEDGSGDEGTEDSVMSPAPPQPKPSHVSKAPHESSRRETEQKTTLRDLSKQAYSRTSLHTRKADPLHRHRTTDLGRGGSSGGRGRGGGQGASTRDRGRGQPDMRLRMNAMLEKIKRDLA